MPAPKVRPKSNLRGVSYGSIINRVARELKTFVIKMVYTVDQGEFLKRFVRSQMFFQKRIPVNVLKYFCLFTHLAVQFPCWSFFIYITYNQQKKRPVNDTGRSQKTIYSPSLLHPNNIRASPFLYRNYRAGSFHSANAGDPLVFQILVK